VRTATARSEAARGSRPKSGLAAWFWAAPSRRFPLYAKGSEKLRYYYAVYLLNKNIEQVRWPRHSTGSEPWVGVSLTCTGR